MICMRSIVYAVIDQPAAVLNMHSIAGTPPWVLRSPLAGTCMMLFHPPPPLPSASHPMAGPSLPCASPPEINPPMRAAGIKRVTPSAGAANSHLQRLRIGISDGEQWVSVMLASQLNALVEQERLQENSVARLDECLFNHVNGRPCAS